MPLQKKICPAGMSPGRNGIADGGANALQGVLKHKNPAGAGFLCFSLVWL